MIFCCQSNANKQRLHIGVQAEDIGAMCKFDSNEHTFSVCFDELDYYFIENCQKQHT